MPEPTPHPWLNAVPYAEGGGIYCAPGGFFIDPARGVDRALVTHGHADHARSGHTHVLATHETLEIMKARYGQDCFAQGQIAEYGKTLDINGVKVSFHPAGHVLGSAQISLTYQGECIVISGDYKRQPDPTCLPFEPIHCDTFITEATFALPVFYHPPIADELRKLVAAQAANPDRAILVGSYALGKAQRIIMETRKLGYDAPIYLHGAMVRLCNLYETLGCKLGDLRPASSLPKKELKGQIVLAPPSALSDRWANSMPDPIIAYASGWMRVRQRAKQKGVELPLIVSDHIDWPDLLMTIEQVDPREVWITHGREDALLRQLDLMGRKGRALDLGYGDDDEDNIDLRPEGEINGTEDNRNAIGEGTVL